MTPRGTSSLPWITIGAVLSAVTLIGLAHQGVRAWQQSAELMAQRRASDTADLLVRALSRDMSGAQVHVLSSPYLDEFMLDSTYDTSGTVASAFARYPYPESFFVWQPGSAASPTFFNRADRPPPWQSEPKASTAYPVTLASEPAKAGVLIERILKDAESQRTFSMFEMMLGDARYQVVARLHYGDALRENLQAVFGFTVNVSWVREHYFQDLIRQVARISGTAGIATIGILDSGEQPQAGENRAATDTNVERRSFRFAFFDSTPVILAPPADLPLELWSVVVGSADDPALIQAVNGADRTLFVATIAAITLTVGLLLTQRATRQSAKLAEMRSEFVATVTHELKTPIATIRIIGDTFKSGRIASPAALQDYAQLVVQETKRLTRLIDNLLAFSRITDVADVYSFQPLDLRALVEQAVEGFRPQLTLARFDVVLELPADTPLVRADRTAIELLLDNLIDNAIRYSRDTKFLRLRISADQHAVTLAVGDRGMGIPPDEIANVTRRFYRGRRAGSGGSGLGLAIAQRIVVDHGGKLEIESVVGEGTVVCIQLPTVREHG